jgi:membrane protease YdiL (CAAX protease family)
MTRWNHRPGRVSAAITQTPRADIPLALVFAAAAAPLVMLKLLVPAPGVLPALSMVSIGSAAVVALFAWSTLSKRDRDHVTLWDVSGACALIGIAAGILSQPEHVIEFLGLASTAP